MIAGSAAYEQGKSFLKRIPEKQRSAVQIAFLRTLGHQGTVSSKAEASRLIDELKGGGSHA